MTDAPPPSVPCSGCGTPVSQCLLCAAKAAAADIAKEYGPFVGQMILSKLQAYLAAKQLPAPPPTTK